MDIDAVMLKVFGMSSSIHTNNMVSQLSQKMALYNCGIFESMTSAINSSLVTVDQSSLVTGIQKSKPG